MKYFLAILISIYVLGCDRSIISTTQDKSGLNLDFEQVRPNNTPVRWYLSKGKNFKFSLDTEIVFSGKRSLHISAATQESAQREAEASASSILPIDDVRGKKITYLGYIRTVDVSAGNAYLELIIYGKSGPLTIDTMGERGVHGTTDWKQYKIELMVDSSATSVSFGVGDNSCTGSAWFDKLEIFVDDKPYKYNLLTLKDDQLEWLKHSARPFKTSLAESGFDDLDPVKEIVGTAEVVGLGEATHGTKEFSEMKHRLVEYLANNMGFSIFAIEANMPEAYRINDYIHGGAGNVRELMKGMYLWTINTKEVEEMIEWMRRYNTSSKGDIEFTGFDMQNPDVAEQNVKDFIQKADPVYISELTLKYDAVSRASGIARGTLILGSEVEKKAGIIQGSSAANSVLEHLESNREKYIRKNTSHIIDWAIQNANIVVQATSMEVLSGNYTYRDSCMAENVRWIKDHASPASKLILWAHNGHVAKSDGWRMGCYLNQIFGKKYRAIGFKFHEGVYTAWSGGTLSSSNVAISYDPGTLDWIFHSLGMPRFILDLQRTSASDPHSCWLYQKIESKDIGHTAEDGYIFQIVPDRWDAIIFFDKTNASDCFFVKG